MDDKRGQAAYREQMIRGIAGVVAAGFLLCAGLLIGGGATVTYAGQTTTCSGPIVSAEFPEDPATQANRADRGLARECARTDRERLGLAVGAGLLALAALAACSAAKKNSTEADDKNTVVVPNSATV